MPICPQSSARRPCIGAPDDGCVGRAQRKVCILFDELGSTREIVRRQVGQVQVTGVEQAQELGLDVGTRIAFEEESGSSAAMGTSTPLNSQYTYNYEVTAAQVNLIAGMFDKYARIVAPDADSPFEHTWTSSDETTTEDVTYTSVGTARIGDQQVEVYWVDPKQNPKYTGGDTTYYLARVGVVKTPTGVADSTLETTSIVMGLRIHPDRVDFGHDAAIALVSSLAAPECARAMITAQAELRLGTGLNGDGKAATEADIATVPNAVGNTE